MKARILRLCKEERGSGIILFALAFVALLSFTAITVDIGTVAANRTKLQSALDAASLAAASVLPNEEAAIAEAQSYMEKNGFAASDIASVDFSADGTTVTVTGSRTVPYTFARVLGVRDAQLTNVASASTEPVENGGGGTFLSSEYVLFSGSKTIPLNFNGWGNVINGSVHTNAKMIVDTLVTINGAAEASNGFAISYDPQFVCTNRIPNAPIIEMSTFNYVFPSAVPAAPTGVTWTTANPGWQGSGDYVISSPIYFDGDFEADCGGQVRITGNGCVIATGNVTLGGTTIDTNNSVAIQSLNGSVLFTETSQMTGGSGSIIAKGDVTFRGSPFTLSTGNLVAVRSVTGAVTCNSTLTLQGNGCIVAYQDINLKGGTVSIATATHPDLYSETGDINFNNTSIITGIIYAPKGQIYISGSNCTITGSLIADHFNLTNLIAGTAAEFDPYTEGGGSTERKIRLVE